MLSLTYVEIDIEVCSLTYGSAPCTAALGVTGERKCYNSKKTCQDTDNFDPETKTVRFSVPTDYLPANIDAIPSIASVSMRPAVVNPGVDMGERASVTVTFLDHPHSDVGFDKYISDRTFDPFKQGTFWGKWRARFPFVKGRALRVIRGELGQQINQMETRHYIIESQSGPGTDGRFTVVAKDVLKLADGDRAQAPAVSNGELADAISDSDGSLTLSPSGIGNLEYPASGLATIGGDEIVSFTRSGDTMTISRAQHGTEAKEHDEGESVQLVLEYSSESPADIIRDLLVTYAKVPSGYIPLTQWKQEIDTYIGRLYTAAIAKPTPVKDLVSELIEQCGLTIWWDDQEQEIGLRVIRPISTDAASFSDDNWILQNSFKAKDQPNKRVSQVWTYYGQINPVEDLQDEKNYRRVITRIEETGEADYGQPAIKKVFSRWIQVNNRPAASSLNTILISRFRDPPRRVSFDVFRLAPTPPRLGRGLRVESWPLQNDEGEVAALPAQVCSVRSDWDKWSVEAEELNFFPVDEISPPEESSEPTGRFRVVIVDDEVFGFNLRTAHDQIYTAPMSGDTVQCVITSGGACVGADTSSPAFHVGSWPSGVAIEIVNHGLIAGRGGAGGGFATGVNGGSGGPGLYTRYAVTVENNGIIGGGGGGGGMGESDGPAIGGGGGGGAAYGQGGATGIAGEDGDLLTGGVGAGIGSGKGGDGGDLGQSGSTGGTGGGGSGGSAGSAVDGDSFVTWDVEGDIRGSQVN